MSFLEISYILNVFFKTIESEKRLRAFYGGILVAVSIGLAAVSFYLLQDYTETIKHETLLSGTYSNEKDAEAINGFLARGASVLRVTSHIAEKSLEHGATQAQIESLLVSEAEYYKHSNDIVLCSMFGILREEFFSGERCRMRNARRR